MDEDELLLSDDLSPTDGGIFATPIPEEDIQEASDQRNMVQTSYPVFEEVLAWFDERIAWASRIDGINTESAQSVESQVIAKQLLKAMLEEERSFLEALRATYSKN